MIFFQRQKKMKPTVITSKIRAYITTNCMINLRRIQTKLWPFTRQLNQKVYGMELFPTQVAPTAPKIQRRGTGISFDAMSR